METTDIEDLAQHFSGLRLYSPTSTTSATLTHRMSDSPSGKTEDDCWGPGRGSRLTSDLDHFICDLALFREKSTDLAKIHFLLVTRTETY